MAAPSPVAEGEKTVATNRRARRDYEIIERFETGIVLTGAEVKSLRAGRASLAGAFGRVSDGEVWIEGLHIPPYDHDGRREHDPSRARKLLMHRREIDRLVGKTEERGLALVPLRLYFTHGIAKLELALGRGRRTHEKRQVIAEREHRREMERALRRRNR